MGYARKQWLKLFEVFTMVPSVGLSFIAVAISGDYRATTLVIQIHWSKAIDSVPFRSVIFGRPLQVGLTVTLCYGTASCLSLCNFGVLWPNGWIYQDAT